MFGIEQEYVMTKDGVTPLGFPGSENVSKSVPRPEGPHYCGVGYTNILGRPLAEQHYRYCINAGVNICGINAELLHGQWEYQIGICTGIEAGDHLWVARYIMERLGEEHGIIINYDPKPVEGKEWSASGLHVNFSTHDMREEDGYKNIINGIERLKIHHSTHLQLFGEGNEKRLSGEALEKFTYGVADRSASIRITQDVFDAKKGYFEDRRPASNADPFVVTSALVKAVCLHEEDVPDRKMQVPEAKLETTNQKTGDKRESLRPHHGEDRRVEA
ncbi:glutamine synthetase [Acrasis kona]|uniref:glutamine synthetase n=1 Tax=Acrasis kona TaxID=1008807 RepID=A0AAW2YP48_9EUKA